MNFFPLVGLEFVSFVLSFFFFFLKYLVIVSFGKLVLGRDDSERMV